MLNCILTFWQKNYDDIDVYNIIAITYECTSFQYYVNADLSNILILIKIDEDSHLSMYLPLVSSPEMNRRVRLSASGEERRLLRPTSGMCIPCGPHVLPVVVVASKERVRPSASLEQPLSLLIPSLLPSSIISSHPPSITPHHLQGAQVSPYLNKNRAESIWLSLLTSAGSEKCRHPYPC